MGSGDSEGSPIILSPEVAQDTSSAKETTPQRRSGERNESSSREQDMSEGDQGLEYQS